ncbi:hypothetical protein EC9_14340 [Rosistilla ulvae]|uniref:DUF3108 domain-containing protein n=1 Tax=Rosistilla ulvae TaxID=1930277 RepID=A0A517LX97_9BACT|nr:hypothetical protein [Rosistilla ulvae]QDS87256.1 hypothetical protein EC9_14340 [Rosistilla ulvae]
MTRTAFSASLPMTLLLAVLVGSAGAQQTNNASPAVQAEPAYLLHYQLKAGETLQYQVTHVAKTKTRIRGKDELTNVRSLSTKVWNVESVDPATGQMTFVHMVQDTELSQKIGEADEVRWDSKSGEDPPYQFEAVKATLGKPLTTVSINGQGQEKERESHAGTKANLGMGGLTMPLPPKAIKVGDTWAVPRQTHARLAGGQVKRIDVRELYTLKKVQTGVATITVQSQPITPISDPKVKSQVVQQLSNGTIKFDIDAGRVLSKQLDWDETVVGFEGAESMMEYRARLNETLVETKTSVAARSIDQLKLK